MILNPVIAGGGAEEKVYRITNEIGSSLQNVPTSAKAGEIITVGVRRDFGDIVLYTAEGAVGKSVGIGSPKTFVMPASDVTLSSS